MTNPIQFDKAIFDDLAEIIKYEMWFLETVYDLAGKPLFPSWPDQLIYTPGDNKPTMHAYVSANIVIGDWRPGFLNAGSPLVFVTTFKLLDMFLDLVLEKNGSTQDFRFQQKIGRLKNGVTFPDFIESRSWLKERIIGLYETLEPLRGTIIYAKHFSSTDGNLKVSSSKGGVIGPEQIIDRDQLRALAILVISIIHYVDETWDLNQYKEKVIRSGFDTLLKFHGRPSIGQLEPMFLTVRTYSKGMDMYKMDLKMIRNDLKQKLQNQDVIFDLRVIVASIENRTITAYLIPWVKIENEGDILELSNLQLTRYVAEVPNDIKSDEVFQKLV